MASAPVRHAPLSPASSTADTALRLPSVFSDHMVLQKSDRVPVWGRAPAGQRVEVTLTTSSAPAPGSAPVAAVSVTVAASAVTDNQGRWQAKLDLAAAGIGPGPYELVVACDDGNRRVVRVIRDVLVGEVWLASGQSNMEWALRNTIGAREELAALADNPPLRQFRVDKSAAGAPRDDCGGAWFPATPETAGNFSAVAYYFSKALHKELRAPVGILFSAWGGSSAEAWMSAEALASDPALHATAAPMIASIRGYETERRRHAEAFSAWLARTGRADLATPGETDPHAAPDADTSGWKRVQLPGPVTAPGLPAQGVFWLRREVTLPDPPSRIESLRVELGEITGYETVYWNGHRIGHVTPDRHPGAGFTRSFYHYVPPTLLRPGKNTLVLRIFAPADPPAINVVPENFTAAAESLAGEWLLVAGCALPALDGYAAASVPRPPQCPPALSVAASCLYNAMIHPLLPYALRGVIWYQGETNAGRAWQHRTTFPLLIRDWRARTGRADLPFYFCQLPNFMPKLAEPGESDWAEMRESQSAVLAALPRTGQAVLIDLGEEGDVHPRDKREAGARLARLALARDYGKPVPDSGPVFNRMEIGETGDHADAAAAPARIRLYFKKQYGGLTALPLPEHYRPVSTSPVTVPLVRNRPGSQLEGFAICGEDRKWRWADARIEKRTAPEGDDGDTVIVWRDDMPRPTAVRYAWAHNPTCNLGNAAGLPASPFRTDDFPLTTEGQRY
ncbi:9-O-acetylesterase [Opitutaceae bacterium TAV5]|nr:9-O-acetylesterase [Opitutaceae bacterium TAV5]